MTNLNELASRVEAARDALSMLDEWCKARAAKLTMRSSAYILAGKNIDDPNYRALLGEHRAYLAMRSFIHSARAAGEK